MNQDIIKMAEEADLWAEQELQCIGEFHPDYSEVRDERFFHMAQADMKEKCELAVEGLWGSLGLENVSYIEGWDDALDAAMQAIRAIGDSHDQT